MQNQINLTPITQFTQQLRAAELSQSKEVKMTIQQARLLSLALGEIQDQLYQDYTALFQQLKNSSANEVVSISMDGGGFKDK
jgi:hypothetical protein